MRIDIKNGLADVTYRKGRRKYNKTVTLEALVNSMITDQSINTPLLPFGTRKYGRKGQNHILYIEIPATKRRVNYLNGSGKVIFNDIVPLPWGLMKLEFSETSNGKYRLGDTHIWALKRPLASENDDLYFYPVPNIFGGCNICWGSTFSGASATTFDSLSEVGRIIDMFFSSNYNTDIHPRINKHARYEDLLRDIQDKPTFDYDALVRVEKFNRV